MVLQVVLLVIYRVVLVPFRSDIIVDDDVFVFSREFGIKEEYL